MEEQQKVGCQKALESARFLSEMLKHDGWTKVLKERINARISDKHKVWLKAKTPEVAEMLRLRTAGYEGIFDIISKVLKEGENARILLERNSDK